MNQFLFIYLFIIFTRKISQDFPGYLGVSQDFPYFSDISQDFPGFLMLFSLLPYPHASNLTKCFLPPLFQHPLTLEL